MNALSRAALLLAGAVAAGCTSAPTEGTLSPRDRPSRSPAAAAPTVPHGTRPPPPTPRGDEAWRVRDPVEHGEVAGYADRAGAVPGTVVGFRVSTGARWFRVAAYRLGSYRGGSGHLVWRSGRIRGERQAAAVLAPVGTRTVVAPWHDSLPIDTAGWDPGLYVLKIVTSRGDEAAAPYVVTSPSTRGRVALVVPSRRGRPTTSGAATASTPGRRATGGPGGSASTGPTRARGSGSWASPRSRWSARRRRPALRSRT
jgi:hypothetical protein